MDEQHSKTSKPAGTVRTTIVVAQPTLKNAKKRAKQLNRSFSNYVTTLMRKDCEVQPAQSAAA